MGGLLDDKLDYDLLIWVGVIFMIMVYGKLIVDEVFLDDILMFLSVEKFV